MYTGQAPESVSGFLWILYSLVTPGTGLRFFCCCSETEEYFLHFTLDESYFKDLAVRKLRVVFPHEHNNGCWEDSH